MGYIANFIKKLFSKSPHPTVIRGNIAKLTLAHALDDDSGFYGSYKIVGGKVRTIKRGVLIPITEKATIIYKQIGSRGNFTPGRLMCKYKIVLYKNYVGKKRIIKL